MRFDTAYQALIELAASRHNALTTSEAAEIQFSQRRLRDGERRGELVRAHLKVWSSSALPSGDRHRIHADTLALPGSAASLLSAAWLHGLTNKPPHRCQLWAGPNSTARLSGADVHRFARVDPASDLTEVAGTRTLNKAATLCLMGAACSADVLERAIDEFLRTESERWLEETMARLYTTKAPGPFALNR